MEVLIIGKSAFSGRRGKIVGYGTVNGRQWPEVRIVIDGEVYQTYFMPEELSK